MKNIKNASHSTTSGLMSLAAALSASLGKLITISCVLLALSSFVSAQRWIHVQAPFPLGGADLLLTDGTVLMQEGHTGKWWTLKPKQFTLDYTTGKIVQTGSLPLGYAPLFYASAVLPDGRAIVEGGEYNNGLKADTTLGAIYNPKTSSWLPVSPPSSPLVWPKIGDAPSIVLPDGIFMLGTCCGKYAATLNPKTMVWTELADKSGGGYFGKADSNNEEGWTLMPDNNFLTVDTYVGVNNPNGLNSEYYDTTSLQWFTAGNTPAQLWDSGVSCGKKATHEIGPAVLMTDKRIWATGSNTCGFAGHTAFYDTIAKAWVPGPDFPGVNDAADAPAALAPDGTVLIDTNPGWGKSPSTFYSFDGSSFTDVTPLGFPSGNTEGARMLILPSGMILVTQGAHSDLWFYEPAGTYELAWQPVITGCYPATAFVNGRYPICGMQFSGLSQGSYYGDDSQNATNYPIAVITNDATGHQFLARTDGFSTMGVVTGGAIVTAHFTVLPGTEGGNSTLRLITNGIPSKPVGILIKQQP